MAQLLQYFILIPLAAVLICLLFSKRKEKNISRTAIATTFLHFIGIFGFIVYWLLNGYPVLDIKELILFKAQNIEIFIDFYFDKTTAVYAFVGSLLTWLVCIFSRYYLHREPGFKRFFLTILLFFASYNMVIFAGNLETLFIGWELLGICSFLLIAFYRNRDLPVKNGIKIISFYRLGDICLILAMWMTYQLWDANISFSQLNNEAAVQSHLVEHGGYGVFLAIMILIAAAIKSAQLPFSTWLPRAMEGPTSSSALLYGSLSVHIGVFLLIRTFPYWENILLMKGGVIFIGAATAIFASGMARVQSTVKSQVAYASITQIGLMFISVALGWHVLALIHFAGNAFLRTYQLLVAPSVLNYSIHEMMFNSPARRQMNKQGFLGRIQNSIYVLSIKEWNLDNLFRRTLWNPFKQLGIKLLPLPAKAGLVLFFIFFLFGMYCDLYPEKIAAGLYVYLPLLFSLLALLVALLAFAERLEARKAWTYIIGAQILLAISMTIFHENFGRNYILPYLIGAIIPAVTGYFCLSGIRRKERSIGLGRFHGHILEHPRLAFVFFLSCLGLLGFPFTLSFIGVDLFFSQIHKQEVLLVIFVALTFILMELAVIRIYARVFLGPHQKNYHSLLPVQSKANQSASSFEL